MTPQGEVRNLLPLVAIVVTGSVLYGLYMAIFAFGIRCLMKRNPRTGYTWILSGFMSALFVLSTAYLALFVAELVVSIRILIRPDNLEQVLTGLVVARDWLGSAATGGGLLFELADTVVVWRAYVLWQGSKLLKVLLLALLFASYVCMVSAGILTPVMAYASAQDWIQYVDVFMQNAAPFLSLATNAVATMLIGYKAYYHRRLMKTSMGIHSSISASGAILIFLTESGVVFCTLQIILIATYWTNSDTIDNTAFYYETLVWRQITIFTSVASPVLILIIVDNRYSISDHISAVSTTGDSGVGQEPSVGDELDVELRMSFAARQHSTSSSREGVGADSFIDSRLDPTGSASHPDEGSDHVQDLERGEGVTPAGNR